MQTSKKDNEKVLKEIKENIRLLNATIPDLKNDVKVIQDEVLYDIAIASSSTFISGGQIGIRSLSVDDKAWLACERH